MSQISPIVLLLKFSDVGLKKPTVAEVLVQLSVLLDEFLDKIHRRHRLTLLRKTASKPPETDH